MGWRSYTLWPAGVELPHAHYWHNPATGETTWEMPEQVSQRIQRVGGSTPAATDEVLQTACAGYRQDSLIGQMLRFVCLVLTPFTARNCCVQVRAAHAAAQKRQQEQALESGALVRQKR